MSYELEHQSSERAIEYGARFAKGYDGNVWNEIEKPLLSSVFRTLPHGYLHADLACGTGRIIDLSSRFSGSVHGFDISNEMLQIANEQFGDRSNVELEEIDLRDSDRLRVEYDLITAFRLLLNTDADTRRHICELAYRSLKPGGIFVSNVHCVADSPVAALYKADASVRKLAGRPPHRLRNALSVEAVSALLSQAGFESLDVIRYGFVPRIPKLADLVPGKLMNVAEESGNRLFSNRPMTQFALITATRA